MDERPMCLRTSDVAVRFGATVALDRVSIAVRSPGVTAVLGPNGAGKSTLLSLVLGLRSPTSGAVELFGAPLARGAYPKRRVGALLQHESAYEGATVLEYARLFAALYELGAEAARAIVNDAGLSRRESVRVSALSGGQARALFLAASVAHDPALLVLDEPTAPLDPSAKRSFAARVAKLSETRAVLLCTHDLAEAEALARDVVLLVAGRVRAQASLAALVAASPDPSRGLASAFFQHCGSSLDARGLLDEGAP